MLSLMIQKIMPHAIKTLSCSTKLAKVFRAEEQFTIEVTGPNYKKIRVLWFLFEYERGQRIKFEIRGKLGSCAAIIRELKFNGKVSIPSGQNQLVALCKLSSLR